MSRAKFLRHYGPFELRVEQVWPSLWHCGVRRIVTDQDGALQNEWDRFTCLAEEAAKQTALATVRNKIGPPPKGSDMDWRNCSKYSDQVWDRLLHERGFPGYLEREDMEWFSCIKKHDP